jgi:uncharacterized protein (DUF433 family)
MREIVRDEDVLDGAPRLDGTRIGVRHIYEQYQNGDAPETIASNYDDISVADIHTALAFAFDNPAIIRQLRDQKRATIEKIREQRPVDPDEHATEI